jgi:energy-coupling factor transporter ATP-binding protein EcfA2
LTIEVTAQLKTILAADNLCYTYSGQDKPALRDINIEIEKGDFVIIAGPTGCGKSTLALCLTGLIPQVLGGKMLGKVIVDDKDTRDYEVFQLAQSVGLVFQNAENQLCSLSVEDEAAFGPENLGLSRKEIEKRVNFALGSTSLADLKQRYTFSLSGGQKHKTVIAGTLSMLPKVLVLDEPFSELDPLGCREVLETLKGLNEKQQITIILIEHKLEQALGFARNVILLKEGEIVAHGKPSEVFKDSTIEKRLGLRVPVTLKFSYELIKKGWLAKPALSIDELKSSLPKIRSLHLYHENNPNPVPRKKNKFASENPKKALIRTERLCYSYSDGTVALRDIDFEVFPGDFLAILGGNGAGKTTLAYQISGQLKPTKGKVYIDGKDSKKSHIADLAGTVGYTFQNPDCQLFCKTVKDELAFGPKQLGLTQEKVDSRVADILRLMHAEQLQDRDPHTLSRGQKIGIAIASVLTMRPKVLILDEPTLGQDFARIKSLATILRSMNQEGLAVVVITHDINVAAEYACRVILMDQGKIIADGDPHSILSDENLLISANLEVPTSVNLSKLMGLPPTTVLSEINKALWGSEEARK